MNVEEVFEKYRYIGEFGMKPNRYHLVLPVDYPEFEWKEHLRTTRSMDFPAGVIIGKNLGRLGPMFWIRKNDNNDPLWRQLDGEFVKYLSLLCYPHME